MTPKERAAMQQALEALEACVEKFYAMKSTGVIGAVPMQAVKAAQVITALREALAEQAEQEPVAWVDKERMQSIAWLKAAPEHGTKLYAAPVRTKDLTDDEAQKLWHDTSSIVPMWAHHLHFARAVIAADREKNNANNNS